MAQMAMRCPTSVFKGKAILEGYKWQINQRGVANVIRTEDCSSVEGLVYSITPKDGRALDRSEGVSRGFYERHILEVTLEPHPHLKNTGTPELADWLQNNDPGEDFEGSKEEMQQTCIRALVYVSSSYTSDGSIREEYISRMQKAMHDGRALGMSEEFIQGSVMPHLVPKDDEAEREPALDESRPKESKHEGSSPKYQDQDSGIGPADQGRLDEGERVKGDSKSHSENAQHQDSDIIIVDEEEDTENTTNESCVHSGDSECNYEEGLVV